VAVTSIAGRIMNHEDVTRMVTQDYTHDDMRNEVMNIHDFEAGRLIRRLVQFLGEPQVARRLRRYEAGLAHSGTIYREYYLKQKHPWFPAVEEYYQLVRKAKSIHKHLTTELKALATDAKKVITLQNSMPDSVRSKYRKDLLDFDSGLNYLFEIHVAWHFFSQDYSLRWYDGGSGKRPEFLVKAPGLDFNVECKRISVDIARKIHRKDFVLLADRLMPLVEKRRYAGKIHIVVKDNLKSATICTICDRICDLVDRRILEGEHEIADLGSVMLDLRGASGLVVDLSERVNRLYETKADNAHGAIFAGSDGERPIDPIELTAVSTKADQVLNGIRDRLSDAKTQLEKSKPGLVTCLLEGIDGFALRKLREHSGLQLMTREVLSDDKFSHIAAIVYWSESMVQTAANSEDIFNAGLLFKNGKCRFESARVFKFLNPPTF